MKLSKKHIYLVIGPARSGTSAITRGLKALGISLGEKLTHPEAWNPTGFWEDNELVYQVNEKVLAKLDTYWDSITLPNALLQNSNALAQLKNHAKTLLAERFTHDDCWGFKDPRTATLLPFWQSVFTEMNLQHHYIIALRHPLTCAQSYQAMTGASLQHGLLLWMSHLFAAIEWTMGQHRVIISYDALMQDPQGQLRRMQVGMNLPEGNKEEISQYAKSFIDKKLYHHPNSRALDQHEALVGFELCLNLYHLLARVATDEFSLDSVSFQEEWSNIRLQYLQRQPLNTYLNQLIMDNQQLTKTLSKLHRSRLWRLIYPLRVVDNFLRTNRKKWKAYLLRFRDI